MPCRAASLCRRVAVSSSPSQSLWITDDVLADAWNRFARVSNAHRRHGSNVPGPLEARRRMAKRRMGVAAAVGPSASPQFDLGALFAFRSIGGERKNDDWKYEPPGLKQPDDNAPLTEHRYWPFGNTQEKQDAWDKFLEPPDQSPTEQDPIETSRAAFDNLLSSISNEQQLQVHHLDSTFHFLQGPEDETEAHNTARQAEWLQSRSVSAEVLSAFATLVRDKIRLGTLPPSDIASVIVAILQSDAFDAVASHVKAILDPLLVDDAYLIRRDVCALTTERLLDMEQQPASDGKESPSRTVRIWLTCLQRSGVFHGLRDNLSARAIYGLLAARFPNPSALGEHWSGCSTYVLSLILLTHWVPNILALQVAQSTKVPLQISNDRVHKTLKPLPPPSSAYATVESMRNLFQEMVRRDTGITRRGRIFRWPPLVSFFAVLRRNGVSAESLSQEIFEILFQHYQPAYISKICHCMLAARSAGLSNDIARLCIEFFIKKGELDFASGLFKAAHSLPLSACYELPLRLIRASKFNVWPILQRQTPNDLVARHQRNPARLKLTLEHVDLIHLAAYEWATSPRLRPRVAFRRVHECFLFLRDRLAPLNHLLARAVIHAGVTRYFKEHRRLSKVMFGYVLHIVSLIEGNEVADALDRSVWKLWNESVLPSIMERERAGIAEQNVSQRVHTIIGLPERSKVEYQAAWRRLRKAHYSSRGWLDPETSRRRKGAYNRLLAQASFEAEQEKLRSFSDPYPAVAAPTSPASSESQESEKNYQVEHPFEDHYHDLPVVADEKIRTTSANHQMSDEHLGCEARVESSANSAEVGSLQTSASSPPLEPSEPHELLVTELRKEPHETRADTDTRRIIEQEYEREDTNQSATTEALTLSTVDHGHVEDSSTPATFAFSPLLEGDDGHMMRSSDLEQQSQYSSFANEDVTRRVDEQDLSHWSEDQEVESETSQISAADFGNARDSNTAASITSFKPFGDECQELARVEAHLQPQMSISGANHDEYDPRELYEDYEQNPDGYIAARAASINATPENVLPHSRETYIAWVKRPNFFPKLVILWQSTYLSIPAAKAHIEDMARRRGTSSAVRAELSSRVATAAKFLRRHWLTDTGQRIHSPRFDLQSVHPLGETESPRITVDQTLPPEPREVYLNWLERPDQRKLVMFSQGEYLTLDNARSRVDGMANDDPSHPHLAELRMRLNAAWAYLRFHSLTENGETLTEEQLDARSPVATTKHLRLSSSLDNEDQHTNQPSQDRFRSWYADPCATVPEPQEEFLTWTISNAGRRTIALDWRGRQRFPWKIKSQVDHVRKAEGDAAADELSRRFYTAIRFVEKVNHGASLSIPCASTPTPEASLDYAPQNLDQGVPVDSSVPRYRNPSIAVPEPDENFLSWHVMASGRRSIKVEWQGKWLSFDAMKRRVKEMRKTGAESELDELTRRYDAARRFVNTVDRLLNPKPTLNWTNRLVAVPEPEDDFLAWALDGAGNRILVIDWQGERTSLKQAVQRYRGLTKMPEELRRRYHAAKNFLGSLNGQHQTGELASTGVTPSSHDMSQSQSNHATKVGSLLDTIEAQTTREFELAGQDHVGLNPSVPEPTEEYLRWDTSAADGYRKLVLEWEGKRITLNQARMMESRNPDKELRRRCDAASQFLHRVNRQLHDGLPIAEQTTPWRKVWTAVEKARDLERLVDALEMRVDGDFAASRHTNVVDLVDDLGGEQVRVLKEEGERREREDNSTTAMWAQWAEGRRGAEE